MIKHAYIFPYTLDNHIISYVSQDKKILLTNEYLAVKGLKEHIQIFFSSLLFQIQYCGVMLARQSP